MPCSNNIIEVYLLSIHKVCFCAPIQDLTTFIILRNFQLQSLTGILIGLSKQLYEITSEQILLVCFYQYISFNYSKCLKNFFFPEEEIPSFLLFVFSNCTTVHQHVRVKLQKKQKIESFGEKKERKIFFLSFSKTQINERNQQQLNHDRKFSTL